MQFTITGYSTAMFSTWYFIEELKLLFDAGDGVSASLLQKSRKIEHVFISHPDRDHLTGLLQFNQLNARPGYPVIYYPRDSSSFPALKDFSSRFDPHVSGAVWNPITPESNLRIREDIIIKAIHNGHVPTKAGVKSLSYKVIQSKMKLKPELTQRSGEEIRRIIEEQGKANTHTEVQTTLLGYSGDTPVEDLTRWEHTKILIHEATFMHEDDNQIFAHGNKHSYLEEVLEMVSRSNVEQLILGHFSARYSPEQIDRRIRELCNRYAVNIPVFRVLPGKVASDILKAKPVNA
ncbi:MBL fold metallo-hydrolase [Niastella populi]|uniref:RNAse Z n=1 Tax=Niastella populi TaxID=550983 RepID=A0A1V9FR35_9BACT|nr:MBL fold metallo-hydrolase [Niastella populi]OQP60825.1 RNAse Z [Niastella populi]